MKKPLNTAHPEQPLADEQALLEHYRQHSMAQPSAAIDARILAAAAAELTRAKPAALRWSQRLHDWLFGAGHRLRWSVAFASLASIGLGLGLSLRTLDDLPPAYELGEPLPVMSAAPKPASAPQAEPMAEVVELKKEQAPTMAARMAAPVSPAPIKAKANGFSQDQAVAEQGQLGELKASSEAAAKQSGANASNASLADSAAEADNPAQTAKAKSLAPVTFAQQLQALLQLQRSGASQAAALELQRLQRLYPGRDVAAELAKLQAIQQ